MTHNFFYLFLILNFICSLCSFVKSKKHFLNSLLSLEYMMLSIYVMMGVAFSNMQGGSYFVLFFISLAACEGALGLSLLVSTVRMYGSENFKEFNFLQC